ncbi:MAG: hypothetical protein EAY70_13680 [Sphingomonadales bacterium]|nr:MAG: hypothetical protein EAY70_13680 [Sphingomonadales bacterium]
MVEGALVLDQMRVLMLAGTASVLGGGAWLGGAFDQGQYYAMAPADVEMRLAGLQFGPEAGTDLRLLLRSHGPGLLRWDLMSGHERMAEVRANLSPENPGTRVAVEFRFTGGEVLMGLEEEPFVNEIAQIAMEEKIDSTLEGRAFNVELVQARMAAHVAADPQALTNMQQKLHDKVEEDMIAMSGGAQSDNGHDAPITPGKPIPPPDFSETHADGGWGNK